MLNLLPSIPYPPSGKGYWGPVTSTINWCEEDYYATIYSAEVVNSITNLVFMYLAYRGMSSCIRYGHDKVFLITFVGYLIVGLGSFLYHLTLKYPMQLIDELSMIYTTCIMLYASFTRGRSPLYSAILCTFLVSLAVFVTGYYHYIQDPLFHQNVYALLTATVLLRPVFVMETDIRPRRRSKERELELLSKLAKENANGTTGEHGDPDTVIARKWAKGMTKEEITELKRIDERDIAVLNTMWLMIAFALTVFIGGFVIWNLDNLFCSQLRRWRRQVGLPWGIVLEGHGWWHLMTGLGAYYYIVWGIWLRYCLNGQQDDVELVWPSMLTSFPEVIVKLPSTPKAQPMNGESKKTK